MRPFVWIQLLLTTYAYAQATVTFCESYSYTVTSTFFEYETFYISVDGRGGVRPITPTFMNTKISTTSLTSSGSSTASNAVSNGGIGSSRTTSRSTTRIPASDNVPGNGTSVVIPDNTIAPTTPIPTSLTTTMTRTATTITTTSTSSSSLPSTSSSTSASSPVTTEDSSSADSTSSTVTGSSSSLSSTTVITTSDLTSTTSEASAATTTTSTETSTSMSLETTTTATTTATTTTTTTTTTVTSITISTSIAPIVTNKAYIDTVLRHHNQHRLNHTSPSLTWNRALAETAKKIADSCVYQHDTATDCPNGGCYGQNIGAGYLSTQMGFLISDGFYNSENPYYTYYGGEPDLSTLHYWGHFSQIVWKIDTNSVGCYTTDCSNRPNQLVFPNGGGANIRPLFTVCNYGGPGNWVNEFKTNVIEPIGLPTINAGYLCPTPENCEDDAII